MQTYDGRLQANLFSRSVELLQRKTARHTSQHLASKQARRLRIARRRVTRERQVKRVTCDSRDF